MSAPTDSPRRHLHRLLSLALAAAGTAAVTTLADEPAAHAAAVSGPASAAAVADKQAAVAAEASGANGVATLADALAAHDSAAFAATAPTIALTRWQGPDRYGTAAALALGAYPSGAANVVVASGQSFPDALAASYLAGYLHAPILLTEAHALPEETAAALRKLGATHVYLVGGTAAADGGVEAQLRAVPGVAQVTREAGSSRYDTALAIATAPPPSAVGRINGQPTALLASGAAFPDALAGSAVASGAGLPILLSDPHTLSPQAADVIRRLGITQVLVLGGTAAVSPAVENRLRELGVTTRRLAGSDRGSTAAAIASYAVGTVGFDPSRVAFARGDNAGGGVDALALGVLAGVHHEPLLLTDSPTQAGDATLAWLSSAGARLTAGDVAGGPGAISNALLARLSGAAGGGGTPGGPAQGQYVVTLSGVVGGNAFQRTAIVLIHSTVTTVGTTNGVNPVDVCLISGNPGGVPETGAIWNSSNSACDPGASSAALDMAFVTVDGTTVTVKPDVRMAAAGANVFTARPGITACPYFPYSGAMTVTTGPGGTLTGAIDVVGYSSADCQGAEYQAQISGQRQ